MLSNAIANDCSYTYANIVYSTQSVALACIFFAAKMFRLPLLFTDYIPAVENIDQEYSELIRNKEFDLEGLFRAHLLNKEKSNNLKCTENDTKNERKHYT